MLSTCPYYGLPNPTQLNYFRPQPESNPTQLDYFRPQPESNPTQLDYFRPQPESNLTQLEKTRVRLVYIELLGIGSGRIGFRSRTQGVEPNPFIKWVSISNLI
eukprot:TRINITY_DN3557_c0_g1_i1.p1 TRINITY_DN3557_c0_g1~~TRINITY_DN3557_c0_g1_i1.p1  ORF type:complete len:103 (+),score=1.21 TRINITY_DN3557_c0_g1_i1:275-583(+)